MEKNMELMEIYLNPLRLTHIYTNQSIELINIVDFICIPRESSKIDDLIKRYKEIDIDGNLLAFAPADPKILEKLIWPLRAAKSSYIIGNYLGTIALSGMVAEMIAILDWEMTEVSLNGKKFDETYEQDMFGSSFEKLGQDRRVKILLAYGIIDKQTKVLFDEIRKIRKEYLHLFSKKHSKITEDAVKIYSKIVQIVNKTIGQEIIDGKIAINPKLLNYLKN